MIALVILFGMMLVGFICWLRVMILGYIRFKNKKVDLESSYKKRGEFMTFLTVALLMTFLTVGFTVFSQAQTYTPKIMENGQPKKGAISELLKITLNGHAQFITMRGEDKSKPVLLFLSGGPGGTQMAATRLNLKGLEKEFVVVNWDQRGSGKSYSFFDSKNINEETYMEDGIELANYLRNKFNQDSIYLMGESWGSALGLMMVKESPEIFTAFIGTGQMVDFLTTKKIDYQKALEDTRLSHKALHDKLVKQGPPPYYGAFVSLKISRYLGHLQTMMGQNPAINHYPFSMSDYINSPEYGVLDKIKYFMGLADTFNEVYQGLFDIDLRKTHNQLKVPVFMLLGRHDMNAPLDLSLDYFNSLKYPHKELIWFEHSAHNPWMTEREKFVTETIKIKNQMN